ncbi:hypothetical protein D3C87_2055490 [compost metagenome]
MPEGLPHRMAMHPVKLRQRDRGRQRIPGTVLASPDRLRQRIGDASPGRTTVAVRCRIRQRFRHIRHQNFIRNV